MRLFGSERILTMVQHLGIPEDQPIDARILSNSIETAQKRLEGNNFQRRKNVLEYDDVMNQQRKIIYAERADVLSGASLREKILHMVESTITEFADACMAEDTVSLWDLPAIRQKYKGILCAENDFVPDGSEIPAVYREEIKEKLLSRAHARYEEREKVLFGEETMREVERVILLRNVDRYWMDHLEDMDHLMESVGLQAYAQRNPIDEYRIYGAELFDDMIASIRDDTVRMILSVVPRQQPMKREQVVKPVAEGFAGDGKAERRNPIVNKTVKVGRNDPCPCGSGKKYKKCCGAGLPDTEDK